MKKRKPPVVGYQRITEILKTSVITSFYREYPIRYRLLEQSLDRVSVYLNLQQKQGRRWVTLQ